MKINELSVSKHRRTNRPGRGIAAGQGKTAGRGTKGQKSRTGYSKKPGFEGGQNPLMQRLPKLHGFNSHKLKPETVYTGQLDALGKAKVDNQTFADAGLVSSQFVKVKLIEQGAVTKKVIVQAQAGSVQAIKAIQKAGGTFELVDQIKRTAKAKSN